MSFHISNFGSYGSLVERHADMDGYVPERGDGPWDLAYDHVGQHIYRPGRAAAMCQTGEDEVQAELDAKAAVNEYRAWWEEEWPETVAAAVAATKAARKALRKWQTANA